MDVKKLRRYGGFGDGGIVEMERFEREGVKE
jgi:hypothetical protein